VVLRWNLNCYPTVIDKACRPLHTRGYAVRTGILLTHGQRRVFRKLVRPQTESILTQWCFKVSSQEDLRV
jgi:hypothetical protein